jgi:hypothetical protein
MKNKPRTSVSNKTKSHSKQHKLKAIPPKAGGWKQINLQLCQTVLDKYKPEAKAKGMKLGHYFALGVLHMREALRLERRMESRAAKSLIIKALENNQPFSRWN